MDLLTVIHRQPGVDIHGRTVHRTAVRGVAWRGPRLLLVHSAAVGDYKFPGGGLVFGETHAQTLAREMREECGLQLLRLGRPIGAVVEYNFAKDIGFDTFMMTSHYYECEVSDEQGQQRLEDYEAALDFRPEWIEVRTALQANRSMLGSPRAPGWLTREIFVLEYLDGKIA